MPCRDGCGAVSPPFDYEGALCDVLKLLEEKNPELLKFVDPETIKAWHGHAAREVKERKAALSKLTTRERKLLGV